MKKHKEVEKPRNYATRPLLKEKFTKSKAYDLIYQILEEKLKNKDKYGHEEMNALNKIISDEIKNKLKEEFSNRYKILVHCIIGERRGQGMRIGYRCLWDTNTDNAVWAHYENENIYAFCSAFGIYFY